jgi:hypothetical protein
MCPLCVMSAILLAASAGSAGAINWLAGKHRKKDEDVGGAEGQGLHLCNCCVCGENAAIADEPLKEKTAH